MDQWQAFLKAIIESPDDDTPRLVAADWLDEHGEAERAEFIRVQCELAKRGDSNRCTLSVAEGWEPRDGHPSLAQQKFDDETRALRRRERELLARHNEEWLWGSVPRQRGSDGEDEFRPNFLRTWRRGFVESITCSWEDWLKHADALRAAQPIQRVQLTTRPEVSYSSRPGYVLWMIDDGLKKTVESPDQNWRHVTSSEAQAIILAAEFPGINFDVPNYRHGSEETIGRRAQQRRYTPFTRSE